MQKLHETEKSLHFFFALILFSLWSVCNEGQVCVCVMYHIKKLYDFYFSTAASNLGNVEYIQF